MITICQSYETEKRHLEKDMLHNNKLICLISIYLLCQLLSLLSMIHWSTTELYYYFCQLRIYHRLFSVPHPQEREVYSLQNRLNHLLDRLSFLQKMRLEDTFEHDCSQHPKYTAYQTNLRPIHMDYLICQKQLQIGQ